MLPTRCLVRGAGDLATGVIWRLTRAGWPVIATELPEPLTVRRTVALSSAVRDGEVTVEGMRGVRCETAAEAVNIAATGDVAVLVSPSMPDVGADVVIDARLAKRNIDTTIDDAPLVIALGPGFEAGTDCHAIVETLRGHHLGRVLWSGSAIADTGTPGEIGGRSAERVLRAPSDGNAEWVVSIGDEVHADQPLGTIGDTPMVAPFAGVVRGLIASGQGVRSGVKVGDIDPRCDRQACWEISDKALAVGGGVLEAVLAWPHAAAVHLP